MQGWPHDSQTSYEHSGPLDLFVASLLTDSAISAEFPYGKLHGLFRLPWFRRTWVVQEVAVAKKVVFYCGEHLLAFDNLAAAADFTRLPYSRLDAAARHWKSYLDFHHALAEFIRRHDQGEDVCENVGWGLQDVLTGAVLLDATRPEDKVHGLYGCAKRLGLDLPTPDYTKSVAKVYTEATLACFRQAGNLAMLQMVEGSAAAQFGQPSWVPNFSESLRSWTPINPPKMNGPSKIKGSVSGASWSQWMTMRDEVRLKVYGRRVDQVAAVGDAWKMDARPTLFQDAAKPSGQLAHSLLDCIATWLDIVLERDADGTADANELMAVQDLTHLLANGNPSLAGPPGQIDEYLVVLINCARDKARGLEPHLFHPDDDITTPVRFGEVYLSRTVMHVIEYISWSAWKLVFRTSTKAYLGIGGYSCRPGDLVVVLHGMSSPVLLRPCEGGFNFVSAAFIDGIMDGEFWNAGSEADDEWFILI